MNNTVVEHTLLDVETKYFSEEPSFYGLQSVHFLFEQLSAAQIRLLWF